MHDKMSCACGSGGNCQCGKGAPMAAGMSGCCSSICFSSLMLRLALGGLLFFLGLGKFLMGPAAFVTAFSGGFTNTWLSMGLVTFWLNLMPYFEVVLGAMIFLGLFARWATVVAGFYLVVIIYGGAISSQPNIFYNTFLLLFAAMWLVKKPSSTLSLDKLMGCKKEC